MRALSRPYLSWDSVALTRRMSAVRPRQDAPGCPCGSVVEHSLGKGEVGSSILPMGTTRQDMQKHSCPAPLLIHLTITLAAQNHSARSTQPQCSAIAAALFRAVWPNAFEHCQKLAETGIAHHNIFQSAAQIQK